MPTELSLKLLLLFLASFFLSLNSGAQQKNIPLNHFFTQEVERAALTDTTIFNQTAFKPFLESRFETSRIVGLAPNDTLKTYYGITKVLLKEHLISIKGDDFFIAIDPVFDMNYAYDFADTSHYRDTVNLLNSTRGFRVIGDLGKKFSFSTSFYETQTFLPLYLNDFVDSTKVAPGFGRTKMYKTYGYDYAMAYGNISYSPAKWLNLQFGHDKHFIGHGYRSLLLSDAAFNYPYIRVSTSFFNNKLQYTAMYASLQTIQRLPLGEVPEALFKRKGASFNYLSWMPHRRVELGLFEGIIWQRYDNKLGTVPQAAGAYIPIIGVNSIIQGFDSKQNIMLGANLKVQTTKHSFVYGQLALDDPERDSWGYQVGLKYFDLVLRDLDIQAEWNSLGNFMYASDYPLQNYVHVNQPLGHPTGAATDELVVIANYRWRRVIAKAKYNQIFHSTGPQGNWKVMPELYPDVAAQDYPDHYIQQLDLSAGLYVNPKWNFQVLVGYTNRLNQIKNELTGNSERRTSLIYLALSTNLINHYSDF